MVKIQGSGRGGGEGPRGCGQRGDRMNGSPHFLGELDSRWFASKICGSPVERELDDAVARGRKLDVSGGEKNLVGAPEVACGSESIAAVEVDDARRDGDAAMSRERDVGPEVEDTFRVHDEEDGAGLLLPGGRHGVAPVPCKGS